MQENRLQESMRPSTQRAKRKRAGETPFSIPETPGGDKRATATRKKKRLRERKKSGKEQREGGNTKKKKDMVGEAAVADKNEKLHHRMAFRLLN